MSQDPAADHRVASSPSIKEIRERAHDIWQRHHRPEGFTATVAPVLRKSRRAQEAVIAYLRDLDGLARQGCVSREVIRIIALTLRLLDDRSDTDRLDETLRGSDLRLGRNSAISTHRIELF